MMQHVLYAEDKYDITKDIALNDKFQQRRKKKVEEKTEVKTEEKK
jgi:hypothetical protein